MVLPTTKGNKMNHERNEKFDEWIDDIYEPITLGALTFYASDILYKCDPIAYRCSVSDWESELESEDA
jgi:hypothetical protein